MTVSTENRPAKALWLPKDLMTPEEGVMAQLTQLNDTYFVQFVQLENALPHCLILRYAWDIL